MHGMFLPKKFFVTSGHAQDPESELNAFDKALMDAGIAQCNLVSVSSILPPDAEEVEPTYITPGTITFAVLVRMDGVDGDRIGSGVGWGMCETKSGKRYGIVAEHHDNSSKKYIEKKLVDKMHQMARWRRMQLKWFKTRVESLEVDDDMNGCVLTALVYLPWEEEQGKRMPFKSRAEMEIQEKAYKISPHARKIGTK
ncbi:MAG: pyruvoyl-dependent arginine decarboxylase [Thermoplasmata archaeon HGW-Thermoplasmata-2]|nr:MAG: pyruvoyl-dependent arginine decarboxylase [Thermoplasmata archaeon HGW-Thermoplasmata-2]